MRAAIIALVALALAAPAADARTTSPAAVRAAVAFWQPYSVTPVCPAGVRVHNAAGYGDDVPSYAYTRRVNGEIEPNCDVYLTPEIRSMPASFQCAVIARALGTAWFGLPPSHDRRNVMYADGWVIPGACQRG